MNTATQQLTTPGGTDRYIDVELTSLPLKVGSRFRITDRIVMGGEAVKYTFVARKIWRVADEPHGHIHISADVERNGVRVPSDVMSWGFTEKGLLARAEGGFLQISKEAP